MIIGRRFIVALYLMSISRPQGFTADKHQKRSSRVEWEHVVPAENFGRAFPEWREGHALCVDRKGKAFKGRACAEKVNADYRRMQADMYNLYPAIGSVNAVRSNKNFQMLGPDVPSAFGSCPMKISGNKVEPPERARGQIARSSLYMADGHDLKTSIRNWSVPSFLLLKLQPVQTVLTELLRW